MTREPTVAILLATYNGAPFLEEQLDSIARQDLPFIDVWASDDGSTDGTLEILDAWRARWCKGDFQVITGPRQGYVENFRRMMAMKSVDGAYIAFSDQDDVWDPNKLSYAVKKLDEVQPQALAMYCGRTRLIGRDGSARGLSPLFARQPDFGNAIVQSIAGGNTIVLNRAAFDLVHESCLRTSFVSHDWWCYQIVSGAGGSIIYDPMPRISYRQHGGNLIGENQGWVSRMKRLQALAYGRFADWNAVNIDALDRCRDLLDENGRQTLDGFKAARKGGPLQSLRSLWAHHIHRQTAVSDVALYLAAAFGRL
ncbi:glycosyltransferase family 2 protein [Chelativorans alearense]|uniref:glycosyltransferase family 2 protein n=1 Tax=Chelativorans alearense TaxID=2681495 RepID=UPI0013D64C69|nr:glycosyltransferase family 2 protein [Chelativorans alearense]